jgi:hypothetical protein
MCTTDIKAYGILYGGRQTGKTTLTLKLQDALPSAVRSCRVDFQRTPGITSEEAYAIIARRVTRVLQLKDFGKPVSDSLDLNDFLCEVMERIAPSRMVLIFEELAALPVETREDLANVIRSFFSNRFEPDCAPLQRLLVMMSGSLELYGLAFSLVSTLQNICNFAYLDDLSSADSLDLLQTGLSRSGVKEGLAEQISRQVYAEVEGHPYLTQLLGGMLEDRQDEEPIVLEDTAKFVDQIEHTDPLISYAFKWINELELFPACRDLLLAKRAFSRVDPEMVQLELLGVAKAAEGVWQARNPLFARSISKWIEGKARTGDAKDETDGSKYTIHIDHAQNLVVGDQAQVSQHNGDE